MRAVLTYRDDWGEAEFFATGREEIDGVMARLDELGATPERGRALDFGCGLGRLTRALADHFDAVVGIDISDEMVRQATALNRDVPGCEFRVNPGETIAAVEDDSVDLVYSNITLQHVPEDAARTYIADFFRIASPRGLVVFQMPAESTLPRPHPARRILGEIRRRVRRDMEMNVMPREEVEAIVTAAGGRVVSVDQDDRAGRDWVGYRYVAAPGVHGR